MQKILTDSFIAKLAAPAKGRTEISDARCMGLVLRITPNGVKSFSFRYRARGVGGVSRITLGSYPALALAKARRQASAMRTTVEEGNDPAADRRQQRSGGRTFANLADRYLVEHARRHKRPASAAADERNLRLHVLPVWGRRDFTTIRRGDVVELVEGLITAGKPVLANRVQALVSKIFSFAVDASLREDNPCARMARRGVENAGQRVLADGEIRLFWEGVLAAADTRRTGLALRLALLTGCRVGEIAGISRGELQNTDNPTSAAWLLPGSRTKNGRDHLVPLAPMARQTVLDLLAMIDSGETYLLPTRSRSRKGPMRSNSLTQAMAYFGGRLQPGVDDPAIATWSADPPSPHDLRRTLETRLASIGIPKEIRDRCLNHIPADVGTRHYDRHDYQHEKRAALAQWEGLLTAILSGGSVVALATRRAAS
jgi:integrase